MNCSMAGMKVVAEASKENNEENREHTDSVHVTVLHDLVISAQDVIDKVPPLRGMIHLKQINQKQKFTIVAIWL